MSGERNRLVDVALNEASLAPASPNVEQERRIALFDLKEGNAFAVKGADRGPYLLALAVADGRLEFDVSSEAGERVSLHYVPLGTFLALTSREKGENSVPMAGFPYHQLESYLGKLINAGMRVAICDQVEDARQAKGLVRREVTRIVTAGTVTDDALLDPRTSNYLTALVPSVQLSPRSPEGSSGRGLRYSELSKPNTP